MLVLARRRAGAERAGTQARKLWHELTACVSDLGLLADEMPASGAFLGNLPQELAHLALLNAAALLDEQHGGR